MFDSIYGALIGLLMGLSFHRVAIWQVKKRTDDYLKVESIDNTLVLVLWMALSAGVMSVMFARVTDPLIRAEYVIYITALINISVVDIAIRKIPNELLLLMLITKAAGIITSLVRGGTIMEEALPAVIGLAVGFGLYLIPSLFGVFISAGDVKLSAMVGFCFGLYGFIQASIVEALALLIYLLFLSITKKGGLKTKTCMGPFISLGAVSAILVPGQMIINYLFAM